MTTATDEQFIKLLITLLSIRMANDYGAIDMDEEEQDNWHKACNDALALGAARLGHKPERLQ